MCGAQLHLINTQREKEKELTTENSDTTFVRAQLKYTAGEFSSPNFPQLTNSDRPNQRTYVRHPQF